MLANLLNKLVSFTDNFEVWRQLQDGELTVLKCDIVEVAMATHVPVHCSIMIRSIDLPLQSAGTRIKHQLHSLYS